MPRSKGSTQYAQLVRRRKVQRYLLDGYTKPQVARMLGVDPETVRRDCFALAQQNPTEDEGLDGHNLATQIRAVFRKREQRRAALAHEHPDDLAGQLAIMQQEIVDYKELVALLQSLGLIYREPIEVRFEQRLLQVVTSMSDEQLAALEGMNPRQFERWLMTNNLLHGAKALAAPKDDPELGGEEIPT